MRVLLCLVLFSSTALAQTPPPVEDGPFLPDSQPPAPPPPVVQPVLPPSSPAPVPTTPAPVPTTPAPSVDPQNKSSWDDYGKDDEAGKAREKRDDQVTTGTLAWREIPWSLAAQAGGVTFAFLLAWQILTIPLSVIPCVGGVLGIVGVALPVLAPYVGIAWATEYRSVRAPIIAAVLAGLVWIATGCVCLPPVFVMAFTPLLPVGVIGMFLAQATTVSIANAIFLRRFGRLRVPGEKRWNWDILSTPQPGGDIEDTTEPARPRKKAK